MDRRRLLAVALTISGAGLLAAAAATTGSVDVDPGATNYGGVIGATAGVSLRGYLDHRDRGWWIALLWGVAYATAILGMLALWVAGANIASPFLVDRDLPTVSIAISGFIAVGMGAVLWERHPVLRRVTAGVFAGIGIALVGALALVSGGDAGYLAALLMPTGAIVWFVAVIWGYEVRNRTRAAKAELRS